MRKLGQHLLAASLDASLAGGFQAQAFAQAAPPHESGSADAGSPGEATQLNLPDAKFNVQVQKRAPEEPNFGLNLPHTKYTITGLGPLSGEWDFGGAADAFAALANNVTPALSGKPGNNGTLSPMEGVITIHKADGAFRITYWGGAWQTPAQGINSDFGTFNSLARFGSRNNRFPPGPTFKWWLTWQPSKYFAISGGEMHSLMGTEIGFDYYNPTSLVSELNNM